MKRSCLSILVVLLLASRESRAGDPLEDFPDPGGARALADQGRVLMQKHRYDEACAKLETSVRLEADIGAQLSLAECNEHLGKLATAWKGFVDVATRSQAANQPEREKAALKRAQALEPRLSKLVIDAPTDVQGLEVRRDGIAIEASQWGTSIPIDPGNHRITAVAPGKQRWATTVQAYERKTARVAIPRELTPIPDLFATPITLPTTAPQPASVATKPDTTAPPAPPPAAAAKVPTAAEVLAIQRGQTLPSAPPTAGVAGVTSRQDEAPIAATPTVPTASADPPAPTQSSLRFSGFDEPTPSWQTIGWVIAGAGVAGIGLGTGFGLASIDKRDAARGHCNGDRCDATGVTLRNDAITDGSISTASMLLGAGALAGGLVVVFTTMTGSHETAKTIRPAPSVARQGGGVVLHGAW